MKISRYLDEIRQRYDLFGCMSDEWQWFERNVNYDAFLVRIKVILYAMKKRKIGSTRSLKKRGITIVSDSEFVNLKKSPSMQNRIDEINLRLTKIGLPNPGC